MPRLSVVLLPFGRFWLTAFLAEKTFAYLAAAGIQVMALALSPPVSSGDGAPARGLHPTFSRPRAATRRRALALGVVRWRVKVSLPR